MVYVNDGLTLAYDTPNTSGLQWVQSQNSDVSVTAILKPANPSNVVTIRYRVNGGLVQDLRAIMGQTDYVKDAQHFHATFPNFRLGQIVDYAVTGSCAGRQVPGPETARELLHSFRIEDSNGENTRPATPGVEAQPQNAEPAGYSASSEFLARVTIAIDVPQIVGPTPDGIRVTWNAVSGSVVGPKLNAKILQAADWMQLRTDGIGSVDVKAMLETVDGARIMAFYTGIIEWGEDGYQDFLDKNYPKTLRVWTSPRFLTNDSKYTWLNRLQCVGIGEVFLDDQIYIYDAYILK